MVRRVDAHPRLKARARQWYYTWAAVTALLRPIPAQPVRLELEVEGRKVEGVTAIAQNSDPVHVLRRRPVRIAENVGFDDGRLSLAVLKRATQRDMPTIAARVLSKRMTATKHGQIEQFDGVREATLRSISTDEDGQVRRLPVQVDGDYIGEHAEMTLSVEPRALTVVA